MTTVGTLIASFIVLATLPGTVELTLLTIAALWQSFAPARVGRPRRDTKDIRMAVLVPCYNEELGVERTIRSLLGCDNPLAPSDIIVVACNCTDRTTDIARELGCSVIERFDPTRRGKGYGLDNAFKKLANADYTAYLVVDADTEVEENFLDAARNSFAAGAEAVQCILRVANPGINIRTRLMNIAFLGMTYLRPLGRHRLGLSCGLFGNGFGLTAATLREIPYHCYSIAEDLEYHVTLVSAGKFVEFLPQSSVFAEMCATGTAARPQRARWEGGRFRILVDRFTGLVENIGRGNFRVIEPLLDLLLLPLVYHVILLAMLLMIGSGPWFVYAAFSLVVAIAHIVLAMMLGRAGARDWVALVGVPIYVGWKLTNLVRTMRAVRKSAPWERTARGHQPP
jgi:cellulose synthase/poly-beta-1,6-N-acetylglucosamine synthase-like glycosyltransferase